MLNQGYRPPNQPTSGRQQNAAWTPPQGYGYPGAMQPQATQANAKPARAAKRSAGGRVHRRRSLGAA